MRGNSLISLSFYIHLIEDMQDFSVEGAPQPSAVVAGWHGQTRLSVHVPEIFPARV